MSNFDEMSLVLIILLPSLGAVLAMFMPRDRPKEDRKSVV